MSSLGRCPCDVGTWGVWGFAFWRSLTPSRSGQPTIIYSSSHLFLDQVDRPSLGCIIAMRGGRNAEAGVDMGRPI
jgi:hypothetical protein